ncbi:MAG TPA: hypothetical protein VJN69_08980 [Candidatus Acidoferrales bacterium]|nr:hypothetical protein [Candidatus Acidoferrales bacterium]
MLRIIEIEKVLVMRVSKNRDRYCIGYQKYAKDETKEEHLGRSRRAQCGRRQTKRWRDQDKEHSQNDGYCKQRLHCRFLPSPHHLDSAGAIITPARVRYQMEFIAFHFLITKCGIPAVKHAGLVL